jgi:Flp pilus assembly protein TadG
MLVRTPARRPVRRPGATTVELAIIYSALFLILFGLILGAIAVFRYQQVAQLAREGSRWAAVHGTDYGKEQKKPPATEQDVYEQVILPRANGMEAAKLTCRVTWDASNKPYSVVIRNDQVVPVTNNVIVTIEYQWDAFLFGPVTLRSTSVSSMHY